MPDDESAPSLSSSSDSHQPFEEGSSTTVSPPSSSSVPSRSPTPRAVASNTALYQTQAAVDPEAPSALVHFPQRPTQTSRVLSNHAFEPPRPPPLDLPSRGPVLPQVNQDPKGEDPNPATTPRPAALNAKPLARTTAYPPAARPPRHPWGKETDSRRLRRTLKSLYRLLRSLPLPLHRLIPKFLARAISRVLSHRYVRRMPTDIAFDVALFFWTCIVSIFFRVVQARGSWRIPKNKEGPVIFVAAPHHNQFLDPLLLASAVRRASGRRVAFLIAEKSIKRKFIGAAARIMQSIPVARAADSAKAGSGLITLHPADDTILIGLNSRFTKDFMPKGQIQLPKFTGYASAEIVEIISDTEVRIKKPFTNDKAKSALKGEVPPLAPPANGGRITEKARAAAKNDAKDVGEWDGKKGCKYKALPFIDQTMMYASVYERLAEGGSLGIFPEGGSHDRTDLLPLKAGVVIMALGAMAENPGLQVRIVPVGMHYFHADKFRSRAVIEFGAPMEVPQDSVASFKEGGEGKRKAVGQCMDLVFDGLKSVTVRAPDYETLMFIQAGRRLYTPSGTHTSLGQVVELNRRFIMGYNKFKDEPRVVELKHSVTKYNKMLQAYGLRDHQVERAHRAGWRTLGLLFYRIGLLCIWSALALPGVVLNAPIFILAKIISRRKAKEALAASQVKIQGRDVLATWKVLVSLGVTPVLYTFYAAMATWYARRQGWITTWRSALAYPLYTYIILPLMSYSALKVGENSIDIYKSLPPLVVSLIPGNHKAIKRIQETRTQLATNLHKLIDELAPQIFDDFENSRMLHPAISSGPRPLGIRRDTSASSLNAVAQGDGKVRPAIQPAASYTDTDTETGTETETETEAEEGLSAYVFGGHQKSGAKGGNQSADVFSRPLAWADDKIFGWGRNKTAAADRPSRTRSRRKAGKRPTRKESAEVEPLLEKQRDSSVKAPLPEQDEEDAEDVYGSAEEGDEDEDDSLDVEEEQEEGDYEAVFRMLAPGNILAAVNKSTRGKGRDEGDPSPARRRRSRSRSQSGAAAARRAAGSSTGADDSSFGPGEMSFAEKRNRSSDSLATLGGSRRGVRSPGWMTPTEANTSRSNPPAAMSPITRTTALPDPDAPGGEGMTRHRTVSSAGRRSRTHSLREAVGHDQLKEANVTSAAGDSHSPNSLLFADAARKLEAEVRKRDASPEDKRKVRPELAAMKSAEATPRGTGSPFFGPGSDGAKRSGQ
ncbi:Glycerol-3-phosphate/dihydroxyacetone phosphate acyltransferase [Tilletia horrida]|nr:Glycerol-3-phosphate/dihydroxyacetone phosphate acyltransferase [Tilletia horrida]